MYTLNIITAIAVITFSLLLPACGGGESMPANGGEIRLEEKKTNNAANDLNCSTAGSEKNKAIPEISITNQVGYAATDQGADSTVDGTWLLSPDAQPAIYYGCGHSYLVLINW